MEAVVEALEDCLIVGVSAGGRGVLWLRSFSTKKADRPGPHVITYRATLDVPDALFATVVRWIRAHRRLFDLRPWQRAASCSAQALLVLRCLKDPALIPAAARDIGVSTATGYRYFHEAIDVIAVRHLKCVLLTVQWRRHPSSPGGRPATSRAAARRTS